MDGYEQWQADMEADWWVTDQMDSDLERYRRLTFGTDAYDADFVQIVSDGLGGLDEPYPPPPPGHGYPRAEQ